MAERKILIGDEIKKKLSEEEELNSELIKDTSSVRGGNAKGYDIPTDSFIKFNGKEMY